MRHLVALSITLALLGGTIALAQDKKPPASLVFPSKTGDVNFN
jgi:hypothetical protein